MSFNLNVKIIDSFDGDYAFLSNFYLCDIVYEGITYGSVEAAFQAAKCIDNDEKVKFVALNPSEAKKLGRKVKLRSDWEEIKIDVMEKLLRIKFSDANPSLKEMLIKTDDAYLKEGNYWHDTFWGVCNGVGKNHLGRLLMKIRNELQNVKN